MRTTFGVTSADEGGGLTTLQSPRSRGLGLLVLVAAALPLFRLIPNVDVLLLVFLASAILQIAIPLKAWQLTRPGSGSKLFLASLTCALLMTAFVLLAGVAPDWFASGALGGLLGLALGLLFSLGVLRSQLSARWVAWFGIVGLALGGTLNVLDTLVSWGFTGALAHNLARGVAIALTVVFWGGLGVTLLRGDRPGPTEQALPADSPSVD